MSDENQINPERPADDERGTEAETVRDEQSAAGEETTSPAADGAQAPASDANVDADAESDDEFDDLPTITEDELRDLLNEAMSNASASLADDEDASGGAPEAGAEAGAEPTASGADETLLNDLRRVQAEYANYRRRTDREKAELADKVTGKVVTQLLPVLDDLDRARKAGDLEEGTPMQVIVGKLLGIIEKLGVEAYGAAGDAFDPKLHMAVAQLPNPDVEVETVADVVELGYRIGELELRPAKVAVFVPAN